MKVRVSSLILASALLLACPSCAKGKAGGKAGASPIESGRTYRVAIVMDTQDDWSGEVKKGIVAGLDEELSAKGAKASYEVKDTKLDPATAAAIVAGLTASPPDILCVVNYPNAFADKQVSTKLGGTGIKIVSMNPIPVQSGAAESWERPGGMITGVGVFAKLNSALKLLKRVDPRVRTVYSGSWDQMAELNAWWREELARACREEGLAFEWRTFSSIQEEVAFDRAVGGKGLGSALFNCVSAYVNEDGSPADAAAAIDPLARTESIPRLMYEDVEIKVGALMGTCVIWEDIGEQMAVKAAAVLGGGDPATMAWEYPRKYNIILNSATAKRLGLTIPPEILEAAYRVYTDYEGHYLGGAD